MSQEHPSDELVSFEAETTEPSVSSEPPWQILVVDDEDDIHTVTRLALAGFRFDGRGLEILSAHSATEARTLLDTHPDVALILLDVVMETDRAGLDLVHYVRRTLKNPFVRIVLRTGQPGRAPERQIIIEYDINDYKSKGELTATRLFTLVYTGLSAHRDLKELHDIRQMLARRTQELAAANAGLEQFAATIASDIEVPMRNIAGLSNLIRRRLETESGELTAWLQSLSDNVRCIQSVANELKNYAQMQQAGDAQNTEVESVLQLAMRELKDELAQSGARVEHGPLPMMHAQPADLLHVFQTLLTAGVRHGGPSPVIRVTAEPRQGRWLFSIDGVLSTPDAANVSMAPSIEAHMPEFKELSVCRRIVERHGGQLWLERDAGGTVRVCFTLSS